MIKQLAIVSSALIALSLGACSSVPGNFNGLGNDPMSMVAVHKNSDYGQLTGEQYAKLVKHANECLRDTHNQMASVGEVMATNAAADAASGYVGSSIGYQTEAGMLHVAKTTVTKYAPAIGALGAISNGVQGAVNGAKIKSSVVANYVGNCVNGDIHDSITAQDMGGVHVYGSVIRTNNSSNHLPSWAVKTNGQSSNLPANHNEPDIQQ